MDSQGNPVTRRDITIHLSSEDMAKIQRYGPRYLNYIPPLCGIFAALYLYLKPIVHINPFRISRNQGPRSILMPLLGGVLAHILSDTMINFYRLEAYKRDIMKGQINRPDGSPVYPPYWAQPPPSSLPQPLPPISPQPFSISPPPSLPSPSLPPQLPQSLQSLQSPQYPQSPQSPGSPKPILITLQPPQNQQYLQELQSQYDLINTYYRQVLEKYQQYLHHQQLFLTQQQQLLLLLQRYQQQNDQFPVKFQPPNSPSPAIPFPVSSTLPPPGIPSQLGIQRPIPSQTTLHTNPPSEIPNPAGIPPFVLTQRTIPLPPEFGNQSNTEPSSPEEKSLKIIDAPSEQNDVKE